MYIILYSIHDFFILKKRTTQNITQSWRLAKKFNENKFEFNTRSFKYKWQNGIYILIHGEIEWL